MTAAAAKPIEITVQDGQTFKALHPDTLKEADRVYDSKMWFGIVMNGWVSVQDENDEWEGFLSVKSLKNALLKCPKIESDTDRQFFWDHLDAVDFEDVFEDPEEEDEDVLDAYIQSLEHWLCTGEDCPQHLSVEEVGAKIAALHEAA
jgi:hypothetical protein